MLPVSGIVVKNKGSDRKMEKRMKEKEKKESEREKEEGKILRRKA